MIMIKKYFEDSDLNDIFIEYLKMRNKIKKPATGKAIELSIKKIKEFSKGEKPRAIEIIEQSIMNCWAGIFELKPKNYAKDSNETHHRFGSGSTTPDYSTSELSGD